MAVAANRLLSAKYPCDTYTLPPFFPRLSRTFQGLPISLMGRCIFLTLTLAQRSKTISAQYLLRIFRQS